MVTLEQIRQLETKIGRAIDYVHRVNGENVRLQGELDGSHKRIAELEDTVQRFREEQGRIEEGILAALDRLDQFEDVVNKGLSNVQAVVAAAAPSAPAADPGPEKPAPEEPRKEAGEEPLDPELPGGEPPPLSEETGADELDIF
jgi:FtsZ-binding cell division protein ZapB